MTALAAQRHRVRRACLAWILAHRRPRYALALISQTPQFIGRILAGGVTLPVKF